MYAHTHNTRTPHDELFTESTTTARRLAANFATRLVKYIIYNTAVLYVYYVRFLCCYPIHSDWSKCLAGGRVGGRNFIKSLFGGEHKTFHFCIDPNNNRYAPQPARKHSADDELKEF